MNLADAARCRIGHDGQFDIFKTLAISLQDGEIFIDNGIQQGISQIIRPVLADHAKIIPDAAANRIEAVVGLFLKAEQEVWPDKQRDLFGLGRLPGDRHANGDEEMIAILFGLWPLMDIDHVFKGEAV